MPTQEIRLPAFPELAYPNAGNTPEGLCPYAEAIWTGFLGASQILEVKPPLVKLRTEAGEMLGIAIQKNHRPIHQDPSERNSPTCFGQPTCLVIESDYDQLQGSVVAVRRDKVYFRPFGDVKQSVELSRVEAEETEQLGGDPKRIDDLLAYIELAFENHAPQIGRTPSFDELFNQALSWATSQ